METFIARYRNMTALALAIFAQLLLLGYQIKSDKDVRLIRLWGVTAVTPVARMIHRGHEFVIGFWSNYIGLHGARQENRQLRSEVDRLKLENQSLRNALAAADRLKVLASYQQNIASETMVASVIGMGANPNSRVVFLDKGAGAGVRPGMAVITADGIVGKVQAVFPVSSLVLLISDVYSAAGVILENSRAHGVLKGTGLYEARIDYIPNDEKVSVGEKVYTSGEDRIFPKGLVVGTISRVQPGKEFLDILVEPGARLNRLEEVLVVTKGVHQDLPGKVPRAQAPQVLLPLPPPEARGDLLGAVPPAPGAQPAGQRSTADGYAGQTDADKLKQRYRELGIMQGHTFGEGLPGSKPPDFNLGLNLPARKPPAASPPAPAGAAKAPAIPAPVGGPGDVER
jgi:rod shape-determining protein MreC